MPISASSLKRLVLAYGAEVVKADEQEAETMVRVADEEEAVAWRRIPQPDSEVMVVSADEVMGQVRDEGWKEVKVASVSAASVGEEGEKGEGELRLEKHSLTSMAYGMPKRSPTTTGLKVIAAGWKRPNESSALTMAQSGSG